MNLCFQPTEKWRLSLLPSFAYHRQSSKKSEQSSQMCVCKGTVLSNAETLRSGIHSGEQQDLPIQDFTKEAVRRETLHSLQEKMMEQKNVNTD